MYIHYTVLSKELLDYWATKEVKVGTRQRFIREIGLSIVSAKTEHELSFSADCGYVWEKGSKCITMKWEELDKIQGEFSHISTRYFKKWFTEKVTLKNNTNENRLQKQETDVVRGDDTERGGIQGRRNKTSTSVGHLSNQAIHS